VGSLQEHDDAPCVSTGQLPSPEQMRRAEVDASASATNHRNLASFAPPLDGFGNGVKGQLAARFLSRRLGLTLFASEPAT
jgi:hypothetical protein